MRVYLPSWKAKDGTRQTGGVYRYQFHLNGRLYRGSLKTRDKRVAEEKDLDLDRRLLSVPAASAKSRKDQGLPLRSDLAEALAAYRTADAKPSNCVFAPGSFPRLTTFKADLVAAGLARLEDGRIVTEDESGRALDFHCLRVTMVSGLVARGVHPRVAQALARHAKIDTTMGAYTDVTLLDLRGAVEATAAQASAEQRLGRG